MVIYSTQVCIPLKLLFSMHKDIGVQFTDEPTGNLDSKSGRIVIDSMNRINQTYKKTIVMVTHDPQMASHCSRIILLKDGKILDTLEKIGETEEFYQEILERMVDL